MTQELYQKAIRFAGEKHKDQKLPGTEVNYLVHLSNVAMEIMIAFREKNDFDLNYALQLALLHDILEDTDTTQEELTEQFGEKVACGVLALTKNNHFASKEEKMLDSLTRINEAGKEAGIVKLADRITNLQQPPGHWTNDKIRDYLSEARLISRMLQDKNEYLNTRLDAKIAEYERYIE